MYFHSKPKNAARKSSLTVDWSECAWRAPIVTLHPMMKTKIRHELTRKVFNRQDARNATTGAAARLAPAAKRLPRHMLILHPPHHDFFNPMKTIPPSSRRLRAFTLVELLTVIAIIAILAAMLLPVLGVVKTKAKVTEAKLQIQDIVTAVQNYNSAYSRFPVSPAAQANAYGEDITYGGIYTNSSGTSWPPMLPVPGYDTNCSEVISILMNITNFPNGSGATVNTNSQKNPQQTIFLNAKMVGDTVTWPGVGPDLVYRDPWGNPYIISMDLDEDNECLDAFYCQYMVSQNGASSTAGYYGLVNSTDAGGTGNHFQYHGNVMVWSMGPPVGGKSSFDITQPATASVNKNHILSWQ